MPLPEYYNQRHSSALNKISGRLTEGKEFIFAYDSESSVPINAGEAYTNRWYGNAGERKCNELTRHFYHRYVLSNENFQALKSYLHSTGGHDFSWINHFYMLLNDPYYRWASSEFMEDRYQCGLLEIPRSRFDRELKKKLPETIGDGSLTRYGQNLLTAIRDNGLLVGKVKKTIVSPAISVRTLAFMLYTLSDLGGGANDFDGSPLFLSLLKPRDLLVPIFVEGEQLGFWEFTGDRKMIKLNLSKVNLQSWMEDSIL